MTQFAGCKIGTSLSRCVRDIIEGRVEDRDVMVILARTKFDFDDPDSWQRLLASYVYSEWHGLDTERITEVVGQLWNTGRIHQPRQFGGYAVRTQHAWLNVHVEPESEAAQQAFQHYQMLLGLSGELELDRDPDLTAEQYKMLLGTI